MIRKKIESFVNSRRCTLLGVGPMSKNCVDAAIELANEHDVLLFLIASRRQIEAAQFGGGYVNRWSTEDFSRYVIEKDLKGKTILARDHGGPWQNTFETKSKMSLRQAMESAKASYKCDIESGMEAIHIDPSIDIHSTPSVEEVLLRVYELYEYCWETAQKLGKDIIFEIGTEEQTGRTTNSVEELEYTLSKVFEFCRESHLPTPTFIVVQTGTRTLETKNVGSFDAPFRVVDELPAEIQIPRILDVCKKFKIYMKEHNTDYLSDEALSWHPKFGIHAANVAPEFGVAESRAFLEITKLHQLEKPREAFLQLAHDSHKWDKWMIPNTTATAYDKAVISGHYVFGTPQFAEIRAEVGKALEIRGINLDAFLKDRIKESIFRYFKCFNLLSV